MLIFDLEKFDSQRVYLLKARIGNIKDSIALDIYCSHRGRRYSDNERIARIVLGYIIKDAMEDKEYEINYDKANAMFISLDTNQIDPYIERAIHESAGADFYYAFEKEWEWIFLKT